MWHKTFATLKNPEMASNRICPLGEEDLSCFTPELIDELNRTEDVVDVLLTLVTWTHFNPFNPRYMNVYAERSVFACERSAKSYRRQDADTDANSDGWVVESKTDLAAKVVERIARHVVEQMKTRVNSGEMLRRLEMYETIGRFADSKLAEEVLDAIRSNSYMVEQVHAEVRNEIDDIPVV